MCKSLDMLQFPSTDIVLHAKTGSLDGQFCCVILNSDTVDSSESVSYVGGIIGATFNNLNI